MPHILINRIPLYYEVSGSGDCCIVFIHGMGLSHSIWLGQVPHFAKKYKVLTYDLRGHGRSGCSHHLGEPKNYLDLLADDLYQLLDALSINRAFLVGYSSGCLVALQFLIKYPNKVLGTILSGAFAKVSNFYMYSKLAGSLFLGELHFQNWLAHQVAKSNGANTEQIQLFEYEAKKVRWKESQQLIKSCLAFNVLDQLSKICTPTLFIYGGNERHMMKYRHQFLLSLPHAEICLVPKINHACPTKGQPYFNRLLDDFLDLHYSPADLATLHTNQDTGDADEDPQNFMKGYLIGNAYQANRSRGNQDEWSHESQ